MGDTLVYTEYDKILENLYVGSAEIAMNIDMLLALDIKRIVQVMGDFEPKFKKIFQYKILPIDDTSEVNIKQYFNDTYNFIEDGLSSGEAVFVHCVMGISRSPTIIISYLMKKNYLTMDEAIAKVKSLRPIIDPNPGFLMQLKEYEAELSLGIDLLF